MSWPGRVLRLGMIIGVLCLAIAAAGAPVAATGEIDPAEKTVGSATSIESVVAGEDDRNRDVGSGDHEERVRVAEHARTAATGVPDGGFNRTVIDVTVHADGDGRWVLRYERTLNDDEAVEEFEAFASEFREAESELYEEFRTDARAIVDDGSAATEREMAAESFDRDAYVRSSLNNDIGVVELEFTWVGFAELDDDEVVVGDVFEGGFYIGPHQELVVRPGDDLAFESVDPNGTQSDPASLTDSSSVTWTGERQFTDRRPRVTFQPRSTAEGTPTTSPTDTPESENASGDEGLPDGSDGASTETDRSVRQMMPWLLAVVLLVGAVAWYRDGARGAAGQFRKTIDSVTRSSEDSAGMPDTTHAEAVDEPASEPAVPGERFQSDEDRVIGLLRENGGRMKQSRVVEETEWSKSKVSVLLSEMEDDGTISKLRIGRENVVSLDGHEPDAADSPLDEEEQEG